MSKILAIIFLPFILLIRGSVYLHEHYHLIPSLSILGGVFITAVLIFIYLSYIYGSLTGRFGSENAFRRRTIIALAIVLMYVLHGVFYISGKNLTNINLAKEIRSVHPIVRLSVSTLIHIDKDLIITDADRRPEDYRKMGLKSKNQSLHFRQSSGYSHALDIRTRDRNPVRNFLVYSYFKLMGFNTLRHSGKGTTGDHLHISLMSHDRPYGI